jgi:hypothetical protein
MESIEADQDEKLANRSFLSITTAVRIEIQENESNNNSKYGPKIRTETGVDHWRMFWIRITSLLEFSSNKNEFSSKEAVAFMSKNLLLQKKKEKGFFGKFKNEKCFKKALELGYKKSDIYWD